MSSSCSLRIRSALVTPYVDGELAAGRSRRCRASTSARVRRAARASRPSRRCASCCRAQAGAACVAARRRRCARDVRALAAERAPTAAGRVGAAHVVAPARPGVAPRAAGRRRHRSSSSSAARFSTRRPPARRASWRPSSTADHVKCFAMNAVLGTHQSADSGRARRWRRASAGRAPAGRRGARRARARRIAAVSLRRRARSRTSCTGTTAQPVSLVHAAAHAASPSSGRRPRPRVRDLVGGRSHVRAGRRARSAEVQRLARVRASVDAVTSLASR